MLIKGNPAEKTYLKLEYKAKSHSNEMVIELDIKAIFLQALLKKITEVEQNYC